MTFMECVEYCGNQREFVKQFDRLTGSNLSALGTGSPLDREIDRVTGRFDKDVARFINFVYECVWTRGNWRTEADA